MNCANCNTENPEGLTTCSQCGMNLQLANSFKKELTKVDLLLIVFLAVLSLSAIAQYVIQILFTNTFEGPIKYVQSMFWILQNLSFLLIPLAISNHKIKMIAFVITAIVVLNWIYGNVQFMIS